MSLTGNSAMRKVSTNSITLIRNVEYANWARGKTALNLFHVCATWTREITGMKEVSFIVPRHLVRVMNAVISMSHGYKDVKMD